MSLASKVYALEKTFNVATVTGTEEARRLRYMIRAHYANPGEGDDGKTTCPLYYSSIEGIGGESSLTVASLKDLPKKNADETYRMISPFNVVPMAISRDLSSLMNEFSWDRLEVHIDGEKDDSLSEQAQAILRAAEESGEWTLHDFLYEGASRWDAYTRVSPDPDAETGVRLESVLAEGVYPWFHEWRRKQVQTYRMIYQLLPVQASNDPAYSPPDAGQKDIYVERLTDRETEVFLNNRLIDADDDGRAVSGPHPKQLDEIPLVHVAYRPSGSFFGLGAVNSDIVSAVDDVNVEASNLKNVLLGYGHPILAVFGMIDTPELEWGRRGVVGFPLGAEAEILAFKDVEPLLKTIEQKWNALRDSVVQFVLDDVRKGSRAESGVALRTRLFAYDTYLASVEEQYSKAIHKIIRIALKILGQWPTKGKVQVKTDWGPRFPEDTEQKVKQTESRVKFFGRIPEVLEREAIADGYDAAEVEAILDHAGRTAEAELRNQETAAAGGGVIGASAAERARQERLAARQPQEQE